MKAKFNFRLQQFRLLTFFLLLSLSTPLFGQVNHTARAEYGLAENIKDGAILHAWSWSFNTIKNNMQTIAEAGYTSIQTSPINKCVVGNGGDLNFDEQWYYHYQPTNYTIGNYQLGSKSEFEAMCDEAHRYGIRIIVDAVVNHMTSSWNLIESPWNDGSRFHTNESVGNWGDRYEVTQKALLGLWDLNTQSEVVAQDIKKFLQECVASGASGFRYDAAKHIELPGEYGSNFWNIVLDNGAEYQYGEILQDGISKDNEYSQYMGVTASNYGMKLRSNVNNLSTHTVSSWDINVPGDKMVTWVESHDNYANSPNDWGSSVWMNDWHVKMLWAVIGARKDGAPLFFSRPKNGGNGNRFPGHSKIGDVGDDLYFADEVKWVNHFRNQMIGQSENLRNYNGNSCLMIERGGQGVVIINTGESQQLNSPTSLSDGNYTDQVTGNIFSVSGGTISGSLEGGKVHVIFNPVVGGVSNSQVYATPNSGTSFKGESINVTLKLLNATNGQYSTSEGASGSFTDGQVISVGGNTAEGNSVTVSISAINEDGQTISKEYIYHKKSMTDPDGTLVYFEKPNGWGSGIYIYAYSDGGKNGEWPGKQMENEGGDVYSYEIDESLENAKIIFSDGNTQIPAAEQPGFDAVNGGFYTASGFSHIEDSENSNGGGNNGGNGDNGGNNSDVILGENERAIFFEKPSGWNSTINAYIYIDNGGGEYTSSWPGNSMIDLGNGVYKYIINDEIGAWFILFNEGMGGQQAPGSGGFEVVNGGYYTVSGLNRVIEPQTSTIIDNVPNQELQFYSRDNALYVISDTNKRIRLYNISGTLVRELQVLTGENRFDGLQPGLYISENKKIVIR